ncbi:hypothetical protein [Helicobacter sp. MIT 14-3879]|uniref:hypothetical protein n=1 Tax=Helicobacter sp. MIT 14-3879 TaxID=2040649 RepID=UPI0011C078C5|nr:hypothetical protein [Helicobacter sp. MIT 14-3879]
MQKLNDDFLKKHDFIITFGLYDKNIMSDVCLYPFLDSKCKFYIRYEVGTEEGVSALLLYELLNNTKDSNIKDDISNLDYGYLSAETNIGEEELLELKLILKNKRKPLILIGNDILLHQKSKNIIKMLETIKALSNIDIVILQENSIIPINKAVNKIDTISTLPENNGCIIYIDNNTASHSTLKISNEFAKAWNLQDNAKVNILFDDLSLKAICKIDSSFGGVIGIFNYTKKLECNYRFKKVSIRQEVI